MTVMHHSLKKCITAVDWHLCLSDCPLVKFKPESTRSCPDLEVPCLCRCVSSAWSLQDIWTQAWRKRTSVRWEILLRSFWEQFLHSAGLKNTDLWAWCLTSSLSSVYTDLLENICQEHAKREKLCHMSPSNSAASGWGGLGKKSASPYIPWFSKTQMPSFLVVTGVEMTHFFP